MSAVADAVGATAGKAPEGRAGRALRAMFLVNVAGAGLPGAIIVAAPAFAERHVLWPDQDHATMTMLGSIWLAIGLVSVLGACRPPSASLEGEVERWGPEALGPVTLAQYDPPWTP